MEMLTHKYTVQAPALLGVFLLWRHLYVGLFTPYTVHAPLLYLPYTFIFLTIG